MGLQYYNKYGKVWRKDEEKIADEPEDERQHFGNWFVRFSLVCPGAFMDVRGALEGRKEGAYD